MVIALRGDSSTTSVRPSAERRTTPTFRSLNDGRYFAASSAIDSRPSSASIMMASEVNGLVIEAMRKTVSARIGARVSGSRKPKLSW